MNNKFRKKAVVIEAVQWLKDGDHHKVEMCWFDDAGRICWAPGDHEPINTFGFIKRPAIRTLEGWHEVTPGDWIITGVKGEHYPCKPEVFEMTYEPAEIDQLKTVKEKVNQLMDVSLDDLVNQKTFNSVCELQKLGSAFWVETVNEQTFNIDRNSVSYEDFTQDEKQQLKEIKP